ncbi:trypsin-like peptidase domain-containing protein [Streptomyces griseorubiginosus]|uniref:trypsin-like peptidase domain-containing protein n=1 Tax=Streptomyces griseorubiginosus TaxID=67304 RepID=UPI003676FEFA
MRVHDLAGRLRGVGFVADHHGTVVTGHEVVDGLARIVLHAGDRSCVVSADAVTPLPGRDLALVRTEGLGVDPLPLSVRDTVEPGTYVRLPAGCWREARVLGPVTVTYTATDRFHLLDGVLELAIGTAGRDALRLGGGAAGGPVLDAETGAVVAVLGTALQSGPRDTAHAIPLRSAGNGAVADVRARKAVTGQLAGNAATGPLADVFAQNAVVGPLGARAQNAVPGSFAENAVVGTCAENAVTGRLAGNTAAGPLADARAEHAVSGPFAESAVIDPLAQNAVAGRLAGDAAAGPAADAQAENTSPRPFAENAQTDPLAHNAATGQLAGHAATGPLTDARTEHALPGRPLPEHPVTARRAEDAPTDPLAALLAENAATVPAYGADLNLAGVLELAATSVGQDGPPGALAGHVGRGDIAEPVQRAVTAREFAAFTDGDATVLGLVGPPGSGRTTELAALAARRHRGPAPAPTLWLRGADLEATDDSVADAARRALGRAARIVATSTDTDLGDVTCERLARLSRDAGRPLFLLLDGPEEMPPVLAHRLPEWTRGTARWLRETGARLVVACREEYWEGTDFPAELLYGDPGRHVPPRVPLADLTDDEARRARARYELPDGTLTAPDDRHPLTLRLLSEVRAALPGTPHAPVDRDQVLEAYLDLMCLRIAVRLATPGGLRGSAVRRLAAKVSGQVHEAARRSLGPGQGELDRASFEAVFPWGPAPKRLGGTGWASAVLTEGLLVPAGTGYRFAHEELADWIQGMHLDLDEALRVLVHRRGTGREQPLPVPHHRIGPVVEALLLVARQHGAPQLSYRLEELLHALDADPHFWWAARLLTETLLRVPDATPYTDVLRQLADRLVAGRRRSEPVPPGFGPAFWTALRLPQGARFDLLRRLVLADGPPQEPGPRFLDAVAELLAVDPTAVQPQLTRWFDDDRALPATPHATVAEAAQALLHTHRTRALDDLTEVLVGCAHRRGDELLAVLAEDEPSAVCRAVDRWAHDERPARRVAAVAYGLRAAPHVRTEADRELLRYAALALLARPEDRALHGGALALLVRDPHTRARHLPQALGHFAAGDPQFPPGALVPALATHPGPVLDAFRERLRRPGAGDALRTLADVTTPALARRVAALVREAVERRPETAADVAAYVDRRLDQGPAARAVLLPLVTGLLDGGPEGVRAALAAVLAGPGTPASRPMRDELLDHLLDHEQEPAVLAALLPAAAARADADIRALVHRIGLLLVRTPDGATRFDRGLVDLGRHVPGFAALVAGWLAEAPREWAAVVGPSTRRMIGNLAGVRVPA